MKGTLDAKDLQSNENEDNFHSDELEEQDGNAAELNGSSGSNELVALAVIVSNK
jgi:hypothetical protein